MELQDTLRVKKSNSVALGWLNMQHHSLRGKSLGLGAPGDGSDPPPPELLEKHVQRLLLVVELLRGRR